MAGISVNAARAAARELVAAGWLAAIPGERKRPRRLGAVFPQEVERQMLDTVQLAFDSSANQGEWLMRAKLDLFVGSTSYIDNCRPEWMRNITTGHKLEFDRYYEMLKVALEYQGWSHHAPSTQQNPRDLRSQEEKERAYIQQLGHDAQKILTCQRRGIAFIEVTAVELAKKGLSFVPADVLPRSAYAAATDSPLADFLEGLATAYATRVLSGKH